MKIDDIFSEDPGYRKEGYEDYKKFRLRIEQLKSLGYEEHLHDLTEECGLIIGYMKHKKTEELIPLAITQFDRKLSGSCKALSTGVVLSFLGLIANGYNDILDDKLKFIKCINETVARIPAMCVNEILNTDMDDLEKYTYVDFDSN